MCTVTYIPVKTVFFLTSNRDENVDRGIALPPAVYQAQQEKLLYLKIRTNREAG